MNHSIAGIEITLNRVVSNQETEVKNIESKLNNVHIYKFAFLGIAFGRKLCSTSISQNLVSKNMSTSVVCISYNFGKTRDEKLPPPTPSLHAPQVLNDN